MKNFVASQTQQNKEFMNQNIHNNELVKQLANKANALATHNKMLETQISQVAQQEAATAFSAGIFPGQPQPNPNGHAKDITLRSGTELDSPVDPRTNNQMISKITEEIYKDPEKMIDSNPKGEPDKIIRPDPKDKNNQEKEKPYVLPPPYKPLIAYP